jgi:hypothetical protein
MEKDKPEPRQQATNNSQERGNHTQGNTTPRAFAGCADLVHLLILGDRVEQWEKARLPIARVIARPLVPLLPP